ncbi:MAG: hypothetical protein ACOC1M_03765 [Halanaerobium sp.]
MKKIIIIFLGVVFVMTMSLGVMANGVNKEKSTGDDPLGKEGAGWIIDQGSLVGWSDSNFTTLSEYKDGVSVEVGRGITVEGIQVYWEGPNNEEGPGKGEPAPRDFNQEINYTIPAYAEIPCFLKMNIFGNGKPSAADSEAENEADINHDDHWILFNTDYGGVIDAEWNFVDNSDFNPADIAAENSERYIQGSDLFTVNLFANVPYGFAVSSEGLGKENKIMLPIEMRTYQGDLNNNDWTTTETLVDDGIEVGDYAALEKAQINMQFRVPFNQVAAGFYEGQVTFSMYSM